ncbi:MAG: hypothetical protein GF311_17505 [Candidatus Lokiarchaeota archaeon]|nr:hypothetical protein [Candidatus Lokiarchaeota archaeon]
MAWNFILISVSIVFIANAFGQLYYAFQLRKKFSEDHNFNNSIATFLLWIVAGILYPFYFWPHTEPQTFFEGLSVFFICIFTPLLISVILLYQYLFIIKNTPKIKEQRTINLFLTRFDNKNEKDEPQSESHTLKIDIYRKGLHLFPALVIILLWLFAVYVWDGLWEADQFWGISGERFGRFLIITAGYSGILIFGALDYVRLSYIFPKKNLFHFLPNNVLDLLSKSMKRQEIFEFTKPATLVMAFTPIFFLPFGIFSSAALIATIGDGAASIMGLKFGRVHYPKKSNKTIIGYISGAIVSFLVSLMSLYVFQPMITITENLILSAVGGVAFLLVDLSNLNIDDNILNPIVCGLVMGFVCYLFF